MHFLRKGGTHNVKDELFLSLGISLTGRRHLMRKH